MSNEELVIVPVPSLVATLLQREREKGAPLTESEVLEIRDECPSIAMPVSVAAEVEAQRGYKDIDPEHCWAQWCQARVDLLKDK